jgi:DNA-binding NtrC family response regulator
MSISVLLVDDEAAYVDALCRRLSIRRLEVGTASSAREALEVLRQRPVDVVVLDVKMPGMDGIDATRAIKSSHPLIEVILLSGHADLEASLEGMARGAFDYLLKPVSIDELVYKIEDAHRRKTLQEEKMRRLQAAVSAPGDDGGSSGG